VEHSNEVGRLEARVQELAGELTLAAEMRTRLEVHSEESRQRAALDADEQTAQLQQQLQVWFLDDRKDFICLFFVIVDCMMYEWQNSSLPACLQFVIFSWAFFLQSITLVVLCFMHYRSEVVSSHFACLELASDLILLYATSDFGLTFECYAWLVPGLILD